MNITSTDKICINVKYAGLINHHKNPCKNQIMHHPKHVANVQEFPVAVADADVDVDVDADVDGDVDVDEYVAVRFL